MIDKNDHRLTAFALGELAEADFPEAEAEISSSLELQAEVEAIRKVAEEVSEILQAEKALDNIVCKPRKIKASFIKRIGFGYYVAGIASVMVVAFWVAAMVPHNNNSDVTISINGGEEVEKVAEPTSNSNSVSVKAVPDSASDDSTARDSEIVSGTKSAKKESGNQTVDDEIEAKVLAIDSSENGTIDVVTEAVEANTDVADSPTELAQNDVVINNFILNDPLPAKSSPRALLNSPYDGQHDIRNPRRHLQESNAMIFNNNNDVNNNARNMQSFVAASKSYSQNLAQNQTQTFGNLNLAKGDFSVNVLSAYDVMRRAINGGKFPLSGEVKVSEYVNNFRYEYSPRGGDFRFVVQTDLIRCPWDANRLLARVSVKRLSDKGLSVADSVSNSNSDLVTNLRPDDEQLKVAVKFSNGKVREYLPMDKIGVEALPKSELEKSSKEKALGYDVEMVEFCDVGAAISSRSEVTLLYEVVPLVLGKVDSFSANEYFSVELISDAPRSDEKKSGELDEASESSRSRNSAASVSGNVADEAVTEETRFAAAVMLYGLLLRSGGVMENCDWETVKALAAPSAKNNEQRKEFLRLVEKASALTPKNN